MRLILPALPVLPALFALAVLSTPLVARAATPPDAATLRCAAAIALGAAAQERGDPALAGLPPLGHRGRRFFARVGEEAAAQSGESAEAIGARLAQAARSIGAEGDLPRAVRACLPMLDAREPVRPARPGPCAALLDLYAQVLRGRDPADPLAATLARESAVLAGGTPPDAAAREQARMGLDDGTSDADDFAACRALAAGH